MQRGVPLLMRAAGELLAVTDEGSLIAVAMRLLGDHHGYGARYLLMRQGDRLITAAAEGPGTETEAARTFSTPIGVGLTGACAELRMVLNVPDVTRDPRFVRVIGDTRSEIVVPVEVRGELLGVLSVESPEVGAFDRADEEELAAFGQLLALALVHARHDAARKRDMAELQALSDVGRRAAALDLDGTLTEAVSAFRRLTTSDSVAIYLWNEGTQRLEVAAASYDAALYPPDYRERMASVGRDQGLTGWVASTREPAFVPDISKDPRPQALPGIPLEHKAAIAVPLLVEDRLLGVIRAVKMGAGSYDLDHFRLARSLADQSALAISAASAHRDQRERVEELTVLSDIAKRLSEVATLGQVLTSAIDGAMRMTGGEGGLVWRRGDDRLYTLAASLNLDASALAQTPPNAPDSNSNEMLRTGEAMLISELDGHPGLVDRRKALSAYHSAIGVPLRSEGHMYGSLFVLHSRSGYFDKSHVRKVEIVAAHAGAALARAEAFEDAQRLAITDELTGFYNARYLNARLREELARAQRYGHELALVLIDSDSLKRVNDRLGHEAGNDHLRRLAKTIHAQVRATDIVARYGGDEFVVLQPEAGIEAARATAERIRKAASVDQDGIATTVSIGVAAFPAVRGPDDLFREADRALSGAKQGGKNAVVVAEAHNTS